MEKKLSNGGEQHIVVNTKRRKNSLGGDVHKRVENDCGVSGGYKG